MPSLSPRSVHVTDQILAVLAGEYPLPVPTREVEERTGYGIRYGQLTYRLLQRLARRGEVEKITVPDMKSRYWRLAAPGTDPADLELLARQADDEAWGGRGPSASYAEWVAEGREDGDG